MDRRWRHMGGRSRCCLASVDRPDPRGCDRTTAVTRRTRFPCHPAGNRVCARGARSASRFAAWRRRALRSAVSSRAGTGRARVQAATESRRGDARSVPVFAGYERVAAKSSPGDIERPRRLDGDRGEDSGHRSEGRLVGLLFVHAAFTSGARGADAGRWQPCSVRRRWSRR